MEKEELKRERKNGRWDKELILQKLLTLLPSKLRLFWRSAVQFMPDVLRKHIKLLSMDHDATWNSKQIPARLHCPSHSRKQCIFLHRFLMFFCASLSSCRPNSGSILPDAELTVVLMLPRAECPWSHCSLEFCHRVSGFPWFPKFPDGQQYHMVINNSMSCSLEGERERGGRKGRKKGKKERWGEKEEKGLRGTKEGKEWKGNCFLDSICSCKSQGHWSMPELSIQQPASTGLCHFQCAMKAYPLTMETGRTVCDSPRTAAQLCQLQRCHYTLL